MDRHLSRSRASEFRAVVNLASRCCHHISNPGLSWFSSCPLAVYLPLKDHLLERLMPPDMSVVLQLPLLYFCQQMSGTLSRINEYSFVGFLLCPRDSHDPPVYPHFQCIYFFAISFVMVHVSHVYRKVDHSILQGVLSLQLTVAYWLGCFLIFMKVFLAMLIY